MLTILSKQLAGGKALTDEQVFDAVRELVGESASIETKADFLTALAQKGETPEEISAFARVLRGLAVEAPLDAETRSRLILDVCGTGGDRLNTFNISTTVALIMAAAGVSVAKHGNRAVTSQAGSADVLEALGVKINLTPEQAAASLRDHHFAFFFAPNFHPAFKQIGPVRRLCGERGQRTIFNFLGPLLNPARPTAQLMGVPRPDLCLPIAKVLGNLGVKSGMVVCGSVDDGGKSRYLDELSTLGKNTVILTQNTSINSTFSLREFPLQRAMLADLAGSDRKANAQIVHRLLHGEERGPKRDAVLLNAAAAIRVAGKCGLWRDAWDLAADVIDSGAAGRKLRELVAASAET